MKDRSKSRAARAVAVLAAVILITAAAFGVYVGDYYRAEPSVSDILTSDSGPVQVCETQYGWFLDGPSTENAMVFYPGAKVDEKAYIPLLYRFAESGMDVCLVKIAGTPMSCEAWCCWRHTRRRNWMTIWWRSCFTDLRTRFSLTAK